MRRLRIRSKITIAEAVRAGKRPFVGDIDGMRITHRMAARLVGLVDELNDVIAALDGRHGRLPAHCEPPKPSVGRWMARGRRRSVAHPGGFMNRADPFDRMIDRAKRAAALDPRLPS